MAVGSASRRRTTCFPRSTRMPKSKATTVSGYLAELSADARKVVSTIRDTVRKHLPKGYEEGMAYGMIYYHIPLARSPKTYNGQPLGYVGLAVQKNYYTLHLMGAYGDPETAQRLK